MSCEQPGTPNPFGMSTILTPPDRHQIYFEKIHPSLPMIHKFRYLAAMSLYVGPALSLVAVAPFADTFQCP